MSRRAERYYNRVDASMGKRLLAGLRRIAADPFSRQPVRPVKGRKAVYRYRVGELRILFTVDTAEKIVTVAAIGPRGDIY